MGHIRILHRDTVGKVFDGSVDFSPEDFAGQVPVIGDMNPGVPVKKRYYRRSREIWTVVGRVSSLDFPESGDRSASSS